MKNKLKRYIQQSCIRMKKELLLFVGKRERFFNKYVVEVKPFIWLGTFCHSLVFYKIINFTKCGIRFFFMRYMTAFANYFNLRIKHFFAEFDSAF